MEDGTSVSPGSSVTRSGACTTVCWRRRTTTAMADFKTLIKGVHRCGAEANRGVPDREGYVRLEWAAGSMQFIFVRLGPDRYEADVHCLVVSLPALNMRLCVALLARIAECLCHGLMLVFEHIGGVPPVIVMDNADWCAGRRMKAEVALTGVSSAFVAHYRLEVRFWQTLYGQREGQRGERGRRRRTS